MSIASDLEAIVKDHLEEQPHTVECQECGSDLTYEVTVDIDLDLIIKVQPCICVIPG